MSRSPTPRRIWRLYMQGSWFAAHLRLSKRVPSSIPFLEFHAQPGNTKDKTYMYIEPQEESPYPETPTRFRWLSGNPTSQVYQKTLLRVFLVMIRDKQCEDSVSQLQLPILGARAISDHFYVHISPRHKRQPSSTPLVKMQPYPSPLLKLPS